MIDPDVLATTRGSLHAVGDEDFAPAIADFCARERLEVEHARDELAASSPFREPRADA